MNMETYWFFCLWVLIFGRYCISSLSTIQDWISEFYWLLLINQKLNPLYPWYVFTLKMGDRRGNKKKNKGSGLKAQDFLKTGLNDTNNDSTENFSQVGNPKTVNNSSNSQPINQSKKISFLTSFERKMFIKNLKNLRTYQNLKISMDCPQIADKKSLIWCS